MREAPSLLAAQFGTTLITAVVGGADTHPL